MIRKKIHLPFEIKKLVPFLFLLALVLQANAKAAQFHSSDVPKDITSGSTTISILTVPSGVIIEDLNISLSLLHTYDSDLWIYLSGPDNTVVFLALYVGGSGDNFTNTLFDDEATISINSGSAPFTGSFQPEDQLSVFDGSDAGGTWTLGISDSYSGDEGTLLSWSLNILEQNSTYINTIVPAAGLTNGGALVTINGINFGTEAGSGSVTFGGFPAQIVTWSDSKIVCKAPPHTAGEVTIVVSNNVGETDTENYIYTNPIPIADTGQTTCYDDSGNVLDPCPQPGEQFYGQDASYIINPPSFTKLDASGNDLPDASAEWVMVRDNISGLIWEIKEASDGLADYSNPNDVDNNYTWCDTEPSTNGGDVGTCGNGTSTENYIQSLNNIQYGGHNDWRLPTVDELATFGNSEVADLGIYDDYFPNAQLSSIWSSNTVTNDTSNAWRLYLFDGSMSPFAPKNYSYKARAVRSGQSRLLDSFVINNNGTVSDTVTCLMWQQESADKNDDDTSDLLTWNEALSFAENLELAGYSDWRLPTWKELQSLVDYSTHSPAIDSTVFPHTIPLESYWSSTTFAYFPNEAWAIYFETGLISKGYKGSMFAVRAVRSEQCRIFGDLDNDNDVDSSDLAFFADALMEGNFLLSDIDKFSRNFGK